MKVSFSQSEKAFDSSHIIKNYVMYDCYICDVIYIGCHGIIAVYIEAKCFVAGVKQLFSGALATEKCYSVHAMHLAAF